MTPVLEWFRNCELCHSPPSHSLHLRQPGKELHKSRVKMAEGVGFEPVMQRRFNNIQSAGWHTKRS
jgi:hypothetical protein